MISLIFRFPLSDFEHPALIEMRRLEQKESKYYCHRNVKHKNGWSKRKTNLQW